MPHPGVCQLFSALKRLLESCRGNGGSERAGDLPKALPLPGSRTRTQTTLNMAWVLVLVPRPQAACLISGGKWSLPQGLLSKMSQQEQQLGIPNAGRREEAALPEAHSSP